MNIRSNNSTLGLAVTVFLAAALASAAASAQSLVVTPASPSALAPFTLDFDVEMSGCTYLNPPSVTVVGTRINALLAINCIVSVQHSPIHFSAPVTVAAPGTYNVTWQISYEPANNLSDPQSLGQVMVGPALPVTVVEYYNAEMDHYFMTSLPAEIQLCDSGRPPCAGWVRTGASFKTWAPGTAGVPGGNTNYIKICRLYNDSFGGKSTHFYAAPDVCEQTLTLFPDWKLETDELFDAEANFYGGGACQRFAKPVYRVYNNGAGGAPNHRFTTDYNVALHMVAIGWTLEGGFNDGAFCVPNVP